MPSVGDIIKANWTLDEFITEGYFESRNYIPNINFRADDPRILRFWARQISPKIERLYARIGWNEFREDLMLVHENEGRLFFSGGKYSVWFRSEKGFVVFIAEKKFQLFDATAFEDIFISVVSPRGDELLILEPETFPEPISGALDILYQGQLDDVNEILAGLQEGQVIRIKGFPFELSLSPLVKMVDGYFFINGVGEFIIIGNVLNEKGKKQASAEVYNYRDGQRLIASLALNKSKWSLVYL